MRHALNKLCGGTGSVSKQQQFCFGDIMQVLALERQKKSISYTIVYSLNMFPSAV